MEGTDVTTPKQLLKDLSFTIIDLETTGGNQKKDKIIEIGLVRIEKLKVVAEKDILIQPNIRIPDFIQKLTTITPNDVKDALPFEEVIDEVLEFIGDSIIVAHNTAFDIPFLNSELKRMGRPPLTNKSLCTNLMTKYLIPNILNSNLNYMSRIFDIEHKKAHRAIDDAKATADLLLVYLNIFIEKKIAKINHLYYPKNRYELDRRTFKKGSKGYLSFIQQLKTPHLITVKGENGVILLAYPRSNIDDEIEFLKKQIKDLDWNSMTIKLYGDFLESFTNFIPHFQKMSSEVRRDVLQNLYATHLNKVAPVQLNNKDPLTLNQEKDKEKKALGDFVIISHLVPEQLNIFPVHLPQHKQLLTFRYPAHQKKLLQYINSKSARLDKMLKGRLNQQLGDFYYNYLNKRVEDNPQSIMVFSKTLAQKSGERFFIEIDEYQVNNIAKYRYPKEYI